MPTQRELPLNATEERARAEQALREAFGRLPARFRRMGFEQVANDRLYGRVLRLAARASMRRCGK